MLGHNKNYTFEKLGKSKILIIRIKWPFNIVILFDCEVF